MKGCPRSSSVFAILTGLVAVGVGAGCHRGQGAAGTDSSDGGGAGDALSSGTADPEKGVPETAGSTAGGKGAPPNGPILGATGLQVFVFDKPSGASRKIGYLRLGTIVARDPKPAGSDGCSGGWYHIKPRGYVCVGEDATLDRNHPLVQAASVRPDLTKPLPYKYAFVRAVAPLYLKVPSAAEQYAAEFKLKEHLGWWNKSGHDANRVVVGANDVAVDGRGVPFAGLAAPANAKETSPARLSTELSDGELFGGASDNDPIPFWLAGGRKIPNVSGFEVPKYAVFANRVRRHTGLAVVGSFATGEDSLDRRFTVTTDLRIVPTSKLKPDSASPFHGVELTEGRTLPAAFVRSECDREKASACAHAWDVSDSGAHQKEKTLAYRAFIPLSGKSNKVGGSLYREASDGTWLKASDLGVASAPAEWPAAANAGQKWIDISIENQTLTLWEGKKPIYFTLVSTGQDGLLDPKTSKSTIRGTFHIRDKHVTATMDSNERSGANGGTMETASTKVAKDDGEGAGHEGEYGKTVRRGQGSFELRDVPYVEYFEAGYALHAAYWHDVFGTARSHGCVNLSPIDAHRVFLWTDPPLPEGWHGVMTGPDTGEGTTVFIHP